MTPFFDISLTFTAKARSPKTAGLMISELTKALKSNGYKQQHVASNLDYLVQKGWVREVVEARSFTTPRGTTQHSERRSYKISDSGIDLLQAASTYQRPEVQSRINITNIRGVTVVGDGNVVNTTFTDLSRVLAEMKQAVLNEPKLQDPRSSTLCRISIAFKHNCRNPSLRHLLFGRCGLE